MRARVNKDIYTAGDGPRSGMDQVIVYKGTEGEIKEEWNNPYSYVILLSAYKKIFLHRSEFDYLDPIRDLADLVEEASKDG